MPNTYAIVTQVRAYDSCNKCTNGKGITSRGKRVRYAVRHRGKKRYLTIPGLASRSLPIGTRVKIPGIGWRRVDDHSPTQFVELRGPSHEWCQRWGAPTLKVVIQRKR